MALLDEILTATQKSENERKVVIDEIVDYYRKYLESPEFQERVKRDCTSQDAMVKRKYTYSVAFWNYSDGCPDTSFTAGAYEKWHHPEGAIKWESRRYKGVELYDIQNDVGPKLLRMTVEAFEALGFQTAVSDNTCWLKYYNKLVTISW